jgi:NAD(P)-dependent dehydrogenase (short-subunit alcohol dehydrogenase family)
MNVENKVALVTGGASGLGYAAARELTKVGASAVIVDLPRSRGDSAASELGDKVRFVPGDVTVEREVQSAIDVAVRDLGGLQIVVNCAGVGWPGRVLTNDGNPIDLERFEAVVRINLIGTFNVIRLAAAVMARAEPDGEERGVIINTSSVAAFEGQIGQAAYSASKGGVASMTLSVARDLASKLIRCVAIAPGIFDTPMMASFSEEVRQSLARSVPHPRRLGTPEEFAALVRHVVENPMLNGGVIRLDGALRMAPR